MKKNLEINDFWNKFVTGDDGALSVLYNHYIHELFSYGLKIHGDDHLVKDCIQEVFIQLIQKRKSLVLTGNTHVYLFKSLRNKILEELRSKNRRVGIINSLTEDDSHHDLSIEQTRVNKEEREQRYLHIARALDSLSNYQMEAVYLKYSQGFEYEKIAEVLEIDIASARTLIFRSLKKIRENLPVSSQMLFFFFRSLSR